MSRTLIAAAAVVAASLTMGGTAHALSCHQHLVLEGDSTVRVHSLCGEPASVTEHTVERTRTVYHHTGHGIVADTVTVTVVVDTWIYDFGPDRFMRQLTFEDGLLQQIDTLGYGTREGHDALLDPRPATSPFRWAWPLDPPPEPRRG